MKAGVLMEAELVHAMPRNERGLGVGEVSLEVTGRGEIAYSLFGLGVR